MKKLLIIFSSIKLTENSFSILDGEMIAFGVGIYPNASLLNHSCRPNCVVIFENSKLMVRCIEQINNDQEVILCDQRILLRLLHNNVIIIAIFVVSY